MAGVTDGDNWQVNLTILGKLDRGNMLAIASTNGKLERKTNWLTKAANKNKTHDDELFKQIEVEFESHAPNYKIISQTINLILMFPINIHNT